ncbi:MAG: hypothetical protein AAGN46_02950 [Acidobacteriota bacterium]
MLGTIDAEVRMGTNLRLPSLGQLATMRQRAMKGLSMRSHLHPLRSLGSMLLFAAALLLATACGGEVTVETETESPDLEQVEIPPEDAGFDTEPPPEDGDEVVDEGTVENDDEANDPESEQQENEASAYDPSEEDLEAVDSNG